MPLSKSAPSTPGFSHNVSEMVQSGHPIKQAIAAAYAASGERKDEAITGKRDCTLDDALAAADELFAKADAFVRGDAIYSPFINNWTKGWSLSQLKSKLHQSAPRLRNNPDDKELQKLVAELKEAIEKRGDGEKRIDSDVRGTA